MLRNFYSRILKELRANTFSLKHLKEILQYNPQVSSCLCFSVIFSPPPPLIKTIKP